MSRPVSMQRLLAAAIALALAAACAAESPPQDAEAGDGGYEIWALDQGTHTLHVYNQDLDETDRVDLSEHVQLPHMIDFTSDFEHAFIASPTSGHTLWMRTADRSVVAAAETGAGSHAAVVRPGDESVITAVIGEATLVELQPDYDAGTLEVSRSLVIAEDPLFAERAEDFPGSSPVCLDYTPDGRFAYVSLGPALADGGLVVLDVEAFELVAAFPPAEVRANCGTIASPDGSRMFVNGGSVNDGVWYVFDTATHELVHEAPSRGDDAHGVWLTPDGSELWMVNRASSNAIVIDPSSYEVIDEIAFVGHSPDIIAMSPDGELAFITLRGPVPQTGPHAIAGDTPGFSVIDIASREVVHIIQPAEDDARSDFHGIGVRPLKV